MGYICNYMYTVHVYRTSFISGTIIILRVVFPSRADDTVLYSRLKTPITCWCMSGNIVINTALTCINVHVITRIITYMGGPVYRSGTDIHVG